MNRSRVLTVIAALAVTLVLYAALGFFLVPALVKQRLTAHVEQQLKHKLALGDVRFNPFTFALEANDFNLQEASGGDLFSFRRLYVNFEAISVFQRAWDFAEITLEAPVVYGELRKDGSNNFTALLTALSDPHAKPDTPPPPLKVQWIRVTEGRIDLADLQAGQSARLRIAPIALELTDMSTLKGEKGPYKLTARTSDGEILTWDGDVSLYPIASTGKLVLTDWRLATFARMLGTRIAVEKPAGTLAATLEYVAGYADGQPSLDVKDFDLRLAGVSLAPKDAASPLAAVEQLALTNMTFALKQRTASIQRLELTKGRIGLDIDAEGRANWSALVPGSEATGAAEPPTAPPSGAPESKDAAPSAQQPPWRIELKELALSEIALKFSDRRAGTEVGYERSAVNVSIAAEVGPAASSLTVSDLKSTIESIALDLGGDRIAAERLELAAPVVKARLSDAGSVELGLDDPSAAVSALTLRHPSAAAKKDALALRAVELGAKSIALTLGSEAPDGLVEALTASITGVVAREPAQGAEILQLERARVEGGIVNLRERRITMERLSAANATAAAAVDAGGKLDWEGFAAAFAGGRNEPKPQPKSDAPAWKALVKTIELQNLAATYSDRRQKPALTIGVTHLNARAGNVGTDPAAPAQISITGRIKDGGELKADGRINLHTLQTDLKLKVGELTLVPLQPILAEYARLEIVSVLASADGRLRYGLRKGAGAQLLFEGDLGLSKVLIEETEPRQPFLVADALRAADVRFSLDPNRLEIPDLRMEGFSGKLVIAEDQSVNLGKVLRPKLISDKPAAQPAAPDAAREDPFPVSIARIRVDRSRLEFADLSLRPQFATRMHELKGVVTGVASAIDSRAQVELEARVDEFGSGRISGAINIFKPRAFTEIDMTFRNLDMTSLAPYTIKFAGYRIASGTLSMDLKYRIKDSMLVGENKLVLDKFELGERVESPTAFNIPLELAIAILKDSDGRIDIGLPVSGSLDDPQFSYGQLIWKAIGNLFTRIVTAPFRALASLFGGGSSDKLEAIEFDPGRDALMPPEKQKLRTVAEALSKRPQLKLTVKPAYAEKIDRAALQSAAVRREIALRSGIKLAPGEDPGPVDYSNPRTQNAIETLFIDRNSSAAARDVRALQKKNAAPSTEGGKPSADTAPAEVARMMAQQLFDAHPVPEAELAALAKRRGDAIAAELSEAGKVDPARLTTAAPAATDGAERSVNAALELTIAK